MAEIEGLAVQLSTDLGGFERGFNRAAQIADTSAVQIERQTRRIDVACQRLNMTATAALRSVAVEMAGLGAIVAGGALSAERIVRYADAWKQTSNQLGQVTRGTAELRGAQDALFAIAQKTRQEYGGVVDLYTRGSKAARELGATQDQLRRFTEGVAMATALSGKSAQQQAGAIQQLGQLLNSTRVQAEEYNSVLDGAPRIAQAVADGLAEAGGSVGKLKRLIDDGKVSNQQFFQALLSQLPRIQAEFAKLAPTMEEAGRVFDNALGRLIGRTDEAHGATTLLAGAIIDFSENLEEVARVALLAGGGIATILVARGLGPLGPALLQGVSGFASLVGGLAKAEVSILRGADVMTAYANVMPGATRSLQLMRAEELAGAQAAQTAASARVQALAAARDSAARLASDAAAQRAAAAAQLELARGIAETTGRQGGYAKALESQTLATRAQIRYARELRAVDAELSAATTALSAADERAATAAAAHAAATQRAALGSQALGVASRTGAVAVGAFNAVLAALGGWTGIGIMVAAGAVYALATRSTEAEEAARALESAQASLDRSVVKAGEGADTAATRYRALSVEMKAVERAALTAALRDAQTALSELRDAADEAMRGAGLNAILNGKGVSPRLREEVAALVAAFRADGKADAFARLLAQLQALGDRVGGSAGAALREMALALADSAGKAGVAGQQIERVKALLTLLDDPANEAARAVLGLGAAGRGAASGLAAAGSAAGLSADDFKKASDALRDMSATYAMSEAAKKNFEASKTASAGQRALLSALADQVEALDTYKDALKENDAAEAASQRERLVSLAAAEASAVRSLTIAAKLQEAARAVAEGTLTMAAARAMAEREGDAAGVDAFTAALTRMREAFQRVKEETKPGKGGGFNPGTNLADFRKETEATVKSLDRMAAAHGQGAAAVEAATRAQEVEQRLLKLGGQNRAAVVALVNEEADARQRLDLAKWVAETDRQMEAARRLADAERDGVAAVEEANTVNAVAEELAQQRVRTGTAEAGVIAAKVRALEGENRRRKENAALRSAGSDLAYARAELALMGQAEPVRERALATLRAQAQAQVEFGSTTSDAARTWLGLQEQIADTRALANYQQAVRQTADTIAQDWTETLFDAMTLQDKNADILDAVRALLRRIALEFLKTNIVLPVVTQVVGSAPSLFGIQGAGGAGAAGTAGGVPLLGGGGGIGGVNLGSLSGTWLDRQLGGGITSFNNWLDTPLIGTNTMNLSDSLTSTAAEAVGTPGLLGNGSVTYGNALGSIGYGLNAFQNFRQGNVIGGVGNTAAAVASIVYPPAAPFIAIGSAILGGLVGNKQPPGREGLSFYDWQDDTYREGGDEGKKRSDANRQAAAQLQKGYVGLGEALEKMAGTALLSGDFAVGVNDRSKLRVQVGADNRDFSNDAGGRGAAAGFLVGTWADELAGGLGPALTAAVKKIDFSDLEAGLADLQFLANLKDAQTALSELDRSLAGVRKAAEKAALSGLDPFLKEIEKADDLGIKAEYVAVAKGQLQSYLDTLANPVDWTAGETAVASFRGELDAMREVSEKAGLGLAAAIDAAERAGLARLASAAQDNLTAALNEANGNGFINQLNAIGDTYATNTRDFQALGLSTVGVGQLYTAQLRQALSGLSEEQLGVVIDRFDGHIEDLAVSLRDAAAAAREQAEAEAARVAQWEKDRTKLSGVIAIQQAIDPAWRPDLNASLATADIAGATVAALRTTWEAFFTSAGTGTATAQQLTAAFNDLRSQFERGVLSNEQYGAAVQLLTGRWQDNAAAAQNAAQAVAASEQAISRVRIDNVQATIQATQEQIQTTEQSRSRMEGFTRSLKQFRQSLLVGNLSPLDPRARYEEARRQFLATSALAESGDVQAIEDLQSVSQSFLEVSKAFNATNEDFGADFTMVQRALENTESLTARQMRTAEDQLAVLRQQLATAEATLRTLQQPSQTDLAPVLAGLNASNLGDLVTWARRQGPDTLQSVLATADQRLGWQNNPYRYGSPADVQSIVSRMTADQMVALARPLGFTGVIADLNPWLAARDDKRAAWETAVRASGYAGGTGYAPPGWAWVGENGRELLRMGGGEEVLPHGASVAYAQAWRVANDRWSAPNVTALAGRAAGGDLPAAVTGLTRAIDGLRADLRGHEAAAQEQRAGIAAAAERKLGEIVDEVAELPRRIAAAVA